MLGELGPLIIDIEGKDLSPEDSEILNHPLVGGIILFTRNYDSPEQIKFLCHKIRATCQHPLLIMVDQEGGRVQRFINGFTRLPSMSLFGQFYDDNPNHASRLATDCGWLMAAELLSVGVDMSLAPVLDLNKGLNSVIGERAFHSNPYTVIHLAKAFIQGMHEAGMATTGKHFPGHGAVYADSHIAVPLDNRPLSQVENEDMIPFIEMIQAGISAIMPAHIIFPEIDKLPVGFSSIWLKDILRSRLNFKGVIFSDDLNMEGANISSDYADRMLAARDAGCDFTLLCNNRYGVIQVLDRSTCSLHRVEKEKWYALKGNFSHFSESYQESKRWQATHEWLLSTM